MGEVVCFKSFNPSLSESYTVNSGIQTWVADGLNMASSTQELRYALSRHSSEAVYLPSEGNASVDVLFAGATPRLALAVTERFTDEGPKSVINPNTAHFQMG